MDSYEQGMVLCGKAKSVLWEQIMGPWLAKSEGSNIEAETKWSKVTSQVKIWRKGVQTEGTASTMVLWQERAWCAPGTKWRPEGPGAGCQRGESLVRGLSFYPKSKWKLRESSRCRSLLHRHIILSSLLRLCARQGEESAVRQGCRGINYHSKIISQWVKDCDGDMNGMSKSTALVEWREFQKEERRAFCAVGTVVSKR